MNSSSETLVLPRDSNGDLSVIRRLITRESEELLRTNSQICNNIPSIANAVKRVHTLYGDFMYDVTDTSTGANGNADSRSDCQDQQIRNENAQCGNTCEKIQATECSQYSSNRLARKDTVINKYTCASYHNSSGNNSSSQSYNISIRKRSFNNCKDQLDFYETLDKFLIRKSPIVKYGTRSVNSNKLESTPSINNSNSSINSNNNDDSLASNTLNNSDVTQLRRLSESIPSTTKTKCKTSIPNATPEKHNTLQTEVTLANRDNDESDLTNKSLKQLSNYIKNASLRNQRELALSYENNYSNTFATTNYVYSPFVESQFLDDGMPLTETITAGPDKEDSMIIQSLTMETLIEQLKDNDFFTYQCLNLSDNSEQSLLSNNEKLLSAPLLLEALNEPDSVTNTIQQTSTRSTGSYEISCPSTGLGNDQESDVFDSLMQLPQVNNEQPQTFNESLFPIEPLLVSVDNSSNLSIELNHENDEINLPEQPNNRNLYHTGTLLHPVDEFTGLEPIEQPKVSNILLIKAFPNSVDDDSTMRHNLYKSPKAFKIYKPSYDDQFLKDHFVYDSLIICKTEFIKRAENLPDNNNNNSSFNNGETDGCILPQLCCCFKQARTQQGVVYTNCRNPKCHDGSSLIQKKASYQIIARNVVSSNRFCKVNINNSGALIHKKLKSSSVMSHFIPIDKIDTVFLRKIEKCIFKSITINSTNRNIACLVPLYKSEKAFKTLLQLNCQNVFNGFVKECNKRISDIAVSSNKLESIQQPLQVSNSPTQCSQCELIKLFSNIVTPDAQCQSFSNLEIISRCFMDCSFYKLKACLEKPTKEPTCFDVWGTRTFMKSQFFNSNIFIETPWKQLGTSIFFRSVEGTVRNVNSLLTIHITSGLKLIRHEDQIVVVDYKNSTMKLFTKTYLIINGQMSDHIVQSCVDIVFVFNEIRTTQMGVITSKTANTELYNSLMTTYKREWIKQSFGFC